MQPFIADLSERIKQHAASKQPLAICGGNTKAFYGGAILGDALDMRPYSGIIEYEAKELVLTVRAGTTTTGFGWGFSQRVSSCRCCSWACGPAWWRTGATSDGSS